jgi:hypothetical protein
MDGDQLIGEIAAAGYEVRHHTLDDVHRVYLRGPNPFAPIRLVGMVIVRDRRVRYAEMLGVIFPWWGATDESPDERAVVVDKSLELLRDLLEANPA